MCSLPLFDVYTTPAPPCGSASVTLPLVVATDTSAAAAKSRPCFSYKPSLPQASFGSCLLLFGKNHRLPLHRYPFDLIAVFRQFIFIFQERMVERNTGDIRDLRKCQCQLRLAACTDKFPKHTVFAHIASCRFRRAFGAAFIKCLLCNRYSVYHFFRVLSRANKKSP